MIVIHTSKRYKFFADLEDMIIAIRSREVPNFGALAMVWSHAGLIKDSSCINKSAKWARRDLG